MLRTPNILTRITLCALLASAACFALAIRSDAGCRAQALARNDDGSSGLVNLGFTVNLFGKTRSAVYVKNNGNLTFDAALSTYTPSPISSIRREMIAPFWGDVDTRPTLSKLVTYGVTTVDGRRAFCANYVNVGFYDYGERLNSFDAVLIDRADTGTGNFDIENASSGKPARQAAAIPTASADAPPALATPTAHSSPIPLLNSPAPALQVLCSTPPSTASSTGPSTLQSPVASCLPSATVPCASLSPQAPSPSCSVPQALPPPPPQRKPLRWGPAAAK